MRETRSPLNTGTKMMGLTFLKEHLWQQRMAGGK